MENVEEAEKECWRENIAEKIRGIYVKEKERHDEVEEEEEKDEKILH